MFRFFRRHRRVMFVALALVIGGMIFFGISTNAITNSPLDAVIKVNGTSITQADFDRAFQQISRQSQNNSPAEHQQVLQQTMNELIREEVFDQEAKKYGLVVSDQELQVAIQGTPAFMKNGKFDIATYAQTLNQVFGMSPKDFEKLRKKDLAGRRVNQLIASAIHVPSIVLKAETEAVLSKETDPKKKKEFAKDPEKIGDQIRNEELNFVFQDWLSMINNNLKVEIVSDSFKKRLTERSPQPESPEGAQPPSPSSDKS